MLSISDYCLGIWGPLVKTASLVDKCSQIAIRRFLGLPKRSCLEAVYLDMSRIFYNICVEPTSWIHTCKAVLEDLCLAENYVNKQPVDLNRVQLFGYLCVGDLEKKNGIVVQVNLLYE